MTILELGSGWPRGICALRDRGAARAVLILCGAVRAVFIFRGAARAVFFLCAFLRFLVRFFCAFPRTRFIVRFSAIAVFVRFFVFYRKRGFFCGLPRSRFFLRFTAIAVFLRFSAIAVFQLFFCRIVVFFSFHDSQMELFPISCLIFLIRKLKLPLLNIKRTNQNLQFGLDAFV